MVALTKIAYQAKPSYRVPRPSNGTATANHANSTSPSSATLANATAGYSTLGGRFQFAAILGAATDYARFCCKLSGVGGIADPGWERRPMRRGW